MGLERQYIAVSVESRKGGVGKTTTALNLARMALDDYYVLYLDLDITGTAASDILKDTLWMNHVHSVSRFKDVQGEMTAVDVDLVELFEKYLEGVPIEGATLDTGKRETGNLYLKSSKINIVSSNLDRSCASDTVESKRESLEPSDLFDSLHSEWFVEMLQEIIRVVAEIFDKVAADSNRKVKKGLLVVIDNAPGYSGYEPLIEDWLTDLGPERGKFLYVGSLDTQDIRACARGLKELYNVFESKWRASRDYILLGMGEPRPERNDKRLQIEDVFLERLVETAPVDEEACQKSSTQSGPNHHCTRCGLCFYRQRGKQQSKGGEWLQKTQSYLGFIINRVPQLLSQPNRRYRYEFNPLFKEIGLKNNTKRVTLNNIKDYVSRHGKSIPVSGVFANLRSQLVPYDEKIETQFLLRHIFEVEPSTDSSHKPAPKGQTPLIKELGRLREKVTTVARWPRISSHGDADYVYGAVRAAGRIDEYLESCRQTCLLTESRWVEEFWDNRFFLVGTLEAVSQPLRGKGVVRSRSSLEWKGGTESKKIVDLAMRSRKHSVKIYKLLIASGVTPPNARRLTCDLEIMMAVWLSLRSAVNVATLERANQAGLSLVVVLSHLSGTAEGKQVSKGKLKPTPAFWNQQAAMVTEDIVKKALRVRRKGNVSLSPFSSAASLSQSFRAFCLAESRILSRADDLRFLIDCLVALARFDLSKGSPILTVRSVAQQVIVEKTMTHAKGKATLRDIAASMDIAATEKRRALDMKILKSIEVMKAYEQVIGQIVGKQQWQLMSSI